MHGFADQGGYTLIPALGKPFGVTFQPFPVGAVRLSLVVSDGATKAELILCEPY